MYILVHTFTPYPVPQTPYSSSNSPKTMPENQIRSDQRHLAKHGMPLYYIGLSVPDSKAHWPPRLAVRDQSQSEASWWGRAYAEEPKRSGNRSASGEHALWLAAEVFSGYNCCRKRTSQGARHMKPFWRLTNAESGSADWRDFYSRRLETGQKKENV